jgi:hypothetical protein
MIFDAVWLYKVLEKITGTGKHTLIHAVSHLSFIHADSFFADRVAVPRSAPDLQITSGIAEFLGNEPEAAGGFLIGQAAAGRLHGRRPEATAVLVGPACVGSAGEDTIKAFTDFVAFRFCGLSRKAGTGTEVPYKEKKQGPDYRRWHEIDRQEFHDLEGTPPFPAWQ